MHRFMERQRFCCRICSDEWFQEERRQAVEWFRAMAMMVKTKATENAERETAALPQRYDPERTPRSAAERYALFASPG